MWEEEPPASASAFPNIIGIYIPSNREPSRCCPGVYSQQWQKWQIWLFSGWRKAVIYYMWKRKKEAKEEEFGTCDSVQSSVRSGTQAAGKTLEYPTLEKKIQFLFSRQAARRWHINPLHPFNNVGSKSELRRPTNARLCHGKFIGQRRLAFSHSHFLLLTFYYHGVYEKVPCSTRKVWEMATKHSAFSVISILPNNKKGIVLCTFIIAINTREKLQTRRSHSSHLSPFVTEKFSS